MTTWTDLELAPHHLASLQESAISPEVAAERGYRTAYRTEDVPEVFAETQRRLLPALVLPVHGVDGDGPVTYRLRPDRPRTDKRKKAGSQTLKYEQPSGVGLRLDVPPRTRAVLHDPSVPLILTEGEKKIDSAVSIGMHGIGLPGVWGWRGTSQSGGKLELPDLDRVAWNGREVLLAFDSDVVAKKEVQAALRRLSGVLQRRGASVRIIRLDAGPSGKTGLDDFIAAGAREGDIRAKIDPDFWAEFEDDRRPEERLRDYIEDAYHLMQDGDGNAFALPVDGPRIPQMLYTGRPSLQIEAPHAWAQQEKGRPVISTTAVKNVMTQIEAACYAAPREPVYLRSAQVSDDKGIVIDLGRQDARSLVVAPSGWEVHALNERLPLFRRTPGVRELPIPESGGSLDELRELLNVSDDTWPLVMGWLIASPFGSIPRPWLFHTGPQGSGKSQGAELVLNVLDPRPALSPMPRKGDRSDPSAVATSSYLLGWDNATSMPQELSDWLCSLVTGTVEERRVLNTTSAVQTLSIMRSGILTGISVSGIRPDLAERMVNVEFERITGEDRKLHGALVRRFEERHSRILGALADAVSVVLRSLPSVDLSGVALPRMGDYAAILRAYDMTEGTDLFGAYLDRMRQTFNERAEDDPTSAVLLSFLAEHGDSALGKVEPGELYRLLSAHRETMTADGRVAYDSYWPKSAARFGMDLSRQVAVLEDKVELSRWKSGGKRGWTIRSLPIAASEEGTASAVPVAAAVPGAVPDERPGQGQDLAKRDSRDSTFKEEKKQNNKQYSRDAPAALDRAIGAVPGVPAVPDDGPPAYVRIAVPCFHDAVTDRYGTDTLPTMRACHHGPPVWEYLVGKATAE